jgi:hypothetical protein
MYGNTVGKTQLQESIVRIALVQEEIVDLSLYVQLTIVRTGDERLKIEDCRFVKFIKHLYSNVFLIRRV